ncbi:MAG: hypothetical protein V3V08_10350, partial [Nannocystaceae bacterium]
MGISPGTAYSRLRAARRQFEVTFRSSPWQQQVRARATATERPPERARERTWALLAPQLGHGGAAAGTETVSQAGGHAPAGGADASAGTPQAGSTTTGVSPSVSAFAGGKAGSGATLAKIALGLALAAGLAMFVTGDPDPQVSEDPASSRHGGGAPELTSAPSVRAAVAAFDRTRSP